MPNPLLGIPVVTAEATPPRVNPLLGIQPVLPPVRPILDDVADAAARGVRAIGTIGLAPLAAGEQLSLAIAQGLGVEPDQTLAPVSQTLADNARADQAAAELRAAEFAQAGMLREGVLSAVESGIPLAATLPLGAAGSIAKAGATRAAATLAAPGAYATVGQSVGEGVADGRYTPLEILGRAGLQGGLELGGELLPIGRFRGGEADLAKVLGEIVGGGRAGPVRQAVADAVPEIGAQAIQEAATGGAQSLADSATSADEITVLDALARAGDASAQSALAGALLGAGVQVPRVAAAAARGTPEPVSEQGAPDELSRVPDASADRGGAGDLPVGAAAGPVGAVGAGDAGAPTPARAAPQPDVTPIPEGPAAAELPGYAEQQPGDGAAAIERQADAVAAARRNEPQPLEVPLATTTPEPGNEAVQPAPAAGDLAPVAAGESAIREVRPQQPEDGGAAQAGPAAAPAAPAVAEPGAAPAKVNETVDDFTQAAADGLQAGMEVEARLPRGKAFSGTVEAVNGDRVTVRGKQSGVLKEFSALKVSPVRKAAPKLEQAAAPRAELTYDPQPGLEEPQRAAETKMADILRDIPAADRAYDALPDTEGGRVLNVDAVRELSPDYQADRPGFSQAVHEPASAYIKNRYRRMLSRRDLPGLPVVRFLAGGGGSGKSTVERQLNSGVSDERRPQLVMDATMGRYASARAMIDQALAAGRQVQIEYVHRPFTSAVVGVVNRARPKDGKLQRTVRLHDLAQAHLGAQDTILRMQQELANDPRVTMRVWNVKDNQPAVRMSVEELRAVRYSQDDAQRAANLADLEQQGREAINREHQRHPIPDGILRAVDRSGHAAGAYQPAAANGAVSANDEQRGMGGVEAAGGAALSSSGSARVGGSAAGAGQPRRRGTAQPGAGRGKRAAAGQAAGRGDGQEVASVPGTGGDLGEQGTQPGGNAGTGAVAAAAGRADAAGRSPRVGDATGIEIPGAAPVPARYEVRELTELKPSHTYADGAPVPTPGYPAALQPRDYQQGNDEDQKVKRQAGAFKPAYLVSDHPDATSGPSVVTADGTVINGNSRVMTLQVLTPEQMAGYRALLEKKAAGFGIEAAAVRAMRQPVLVRAVDMDPNGAEAAKFARQGNVSATQAQSPVRTAASLGGLINTETIEALNIGEDTTFSESVTGPAGREFRRQVLEALPPTTRGQYFDEASGQLTDMGKTLMRDLLLTKALPVQLVERLHDDRAALLRTIEGTLPQLLRMQSMSGAQELHGALVEALTWMAAHPTVSKEGDVAALLDGNGKQIQQGIFADQAEAMSPEGRMLLSFVLREHTRPRRFKDGLVAAVGALDNKANSFLAESMGDAASVAAEALGVPVAQGATFAAGARAPAPDPAPTEAEATPAARLKPGQQAAPERALGGQPVTSQSARGGRIPVSAVAPKVGKSATEPVRRLKSIIRGLRQALIAAGAGDPGLYEGEAPKGTGGIFDEKTGLAALARHGDLDAAAHEIGHRIAWRFRLDEIEGQQGLPTELADFARFGSAPPNELPVAQRQAYRDKEAWAEFIRAAVVNPTEAENRAPAMMAAYRERVPASVRDALQQYGDAARQFLGLAPEARTEANIQSIRELLDEGKLHVAVANWFNLPEALAAARREPRAYAKLTAFMREVWSGMGTRGQDVQASASQATPERLKELRRMMPAIRRFQYLWQNVWGPAYARFAEGYRRRGIDSESLAPEQNFRILNRLLAGNDGRALEQVFGTGLVDGRNRPVVDNNTGERLNWAWLMQPVEKQNPHQTVALIDKALALAVEQRTAAEGDKRLAQGQEEIDDFVADLEAAARGEEGVDTINRLVEAYQELTQRADDAAALRVEVQTLAKSGRKPDLRRLNRWTEAFAKARRDQAAEAAARITGIGGGLVSDTNQAKAALARRDAGGDPDRPAMDEFLRRYRRWANHLVQVLAEKGVFTAEAATAMQDAGKWTNPDTGETLDVYVDLHRIFDGEDTSARVGGRFQGSTRLIANPLRNLIEATLNAIARGERNQAMNALTDAFRGSEGEQVDLHDLGRQVPDETVQAARKDGGSGLVNGRKPYRIMREGLPEWWVFDPWIESSLESARAQGDANLLTRMWGQLTRIMRAGITTTPGFVVRNILRDTQSRVIASETASGAGIKAIFDGFGTLDTKDGQRGAAELSRLAGGSYAGYIDGKSVLGSELARHLDGLVQKGWGGRAVRVLSPKSWLALAEKVGEKAEQINRNAEFVTAFREAKQRGMDDYNASLYAADKSRGLIDFAEAGLWGRQVTRAVLFFNPAVQGLSRFARTWKLVAERTAAGKTIPVKLQRLLTARATVALGLMTAASVGIRLLVRSIGGDDEEEAWQQQPAAIRDFHWMIPMPGGLPNLAVPKEYSWGFFMSGAERLADGIMAMNRGKPEEAKRAFEGYAGSAAGALLPINDVSSLMGGFAPIVEAYSNFDPFRQRSIIPQWETGKDLALRDTSRASDLGKKLQGLMNVDARLIDHVIEGYAGGWGRMATSTGKDAGWWAGTVTGLGKSDPSSRARDVEWVRDFASKNGVEQKPWMKALSTRLKAAYEAPDAVTRDAKAAEARQFATSLRERIEKNPAAFKRPAAAASD